MKKKTLRKLRNRKMSKVKLFPFFSGSTELFKTEFYCGMFRKGVLIKI